MSTLLAEAPAQALERRLANGAQLLFDLEQRGETGAEYQSWLSGWTQLLREYEALERTAA